MALSVLWAALLGALLGLDRNLRDLSMGWAPCAFWAAAGAVVGVELQLSGLAGGQWFWPLTYAACAVAIARYLAVSTEVGGWSRPGEPVQALLAAFAFGMAWGLGAHRFIGAAALATIFALAWRPRQSDSLRRARAQDAGMETGPALELTFRLARSGGRGPEKSGHDDKGGQQREEQGNGEELAHASRPRMG